MKKWLWAFALVLAILSCPPQWYPLPLRVTLTKWFGASAFRPLPASRPVKAEDVEQYCPDDPSGWRGAQEIDGVSVRAVKTCVADNPYAVAAFVRGTNNVSPQTLMKSGLTADAVVKGRDLDGDGDPDEIYIHLEVAELNGGSALSSQPVTRYDIAPGVEPGLWVFAPKLVGMAVENFESNVARAMLRLPSPAIRVEQGDHVYITLENTHYMPHTLHLHGADHGFVTVDGGGNDGVPMVSELPVLPGESRTYELTPRHAGTMFYHCHVQPQVHVMMGLQGLFVVEENRPNNWVQTMNVGAGEVRYPSKAVLEKYAHEYDLQYQDFDKQLGERIREYNDPRLIAKSMNRDYDVTDATSDYFTLNGRSFPYTFRESLLVATPGERVKLRVVNGGTNGIALHTHGHKFTVTDRDGVTLPDAMQVPQDVLWIATAQRYDIELDYTNDGVHSYGPGIWLFHDHQSRGITTDGIGPGGNISAIVYDSYLGANGWPLMQGVSWDPYFTKAYYNRETPVWENYAPGLFSDTGFDWFLFARTLAFTLACGMLLALLWTGLRSRRRS